MWLYLGLNIYWEVTWWESVILVIKSTLKKKQYWKQRPGFTQDNTKKWKSSLNHYSPHFCQIWLQEYVAIYLCKGGFLKTALENIAFNRWKLHCYTCGSRCSWVMGLWWREFTNNSEHALPLEVWQYGKFHLAYYIITQTSGCTPQTNTSTWQRHVLLQAIV